MPSRVITSVWPCDSPAVRNLSIRTQFYTEEIAHFLGRRARSPEEWRGPEVASVVGMTGGKWNTIDITAKGTKLTVLINGMKMVDVNDTKHAKGNIALQYGAGTVKFRNVRLRTL